MNYDYEYFIWIAQNDLTKYNETLAKMLEQKYGPYDQDPWKWQFGGENTMPQNTNAVQEWFCTVSIRLNTEAEIELFLAGMAQFLTHLFNGDQFKVKGLVPSNIYPNLEPC